MDVLCGLYQNIAGMHAGGRTYKMRDLDRVEVFDALAYANRELSHVNGDNTVREPRTCRTW